MWDHLLQRVMRVELNYRANQPIYVDVILVSDNHTVNGFFKMGFNGTQKHVIFMLEKMLSIVILFNWILRCMHTNN